MSINQSKKSVERLEVLEKNQGCFVRACARYAATAMGAKMF